MKKVKKILIVTVLFIGVFALTGCGGKEPITSEQFNSKMEEKGYTITDVSKQFENYKTITKAYVARSKDATHQIEFYELSTDEAAVKFFDNNKSIFEDSLGDVVTNELDISKKNISKYHAGSNGYYMSLSRIKNTVIFARVYDAYAVKVADIIKDLGY